MKILAIGILTSTLLVSCSPSLPDSAQSKLDKLLLSKSLKYHQVNSEGYTEVMPLKVSSHKVVEQFDLTEEEETHLNQTVIAVTAMGAKDYNLEAQKYLIKISFKAPHEGFLEANGELYHDQKALDLNIKNLADKTGYASKCIKRERGILGSYCAKSERVKKEDYDQIFANIKKEYTKINSFKKGELVKEQEFMIGVSTESAGGKSIVKVNIDKSYSRKTASEK